VSTGPTKIDSIASWPTPHNVRELRSFLGLVGYNRKFVKHFGIISQRLTNVLKKGVQFVSTMVHDKTFLTLQQALMHAPVLALSDFSKPFTLETYASDSSIGVVLMQGGHPIAFLSKALGPKSRGLSTYEKECMAILVVVQQWRSYLQQEEFIIYTYHKSLSQLNEHRLHTVWQHKVFSKLLGLQYKVMCKKGVDNRAADALSRRTHEASELGFISSATPHWL
jgi:hypothetical protein